MCCFMPCLMNSEYEDLHSFEVRNCGSTRTIAPLFISHVTPFAMQCHAPPPKGAGSRAKDQLILERNRESWIRNTNLFSIFHQLQELLVQVWRSLLSERSREL